MTGDWFLKDYKKAALNKGRILPQVQTHLIRDSVANAGNRDTKFLHPSEVSKKDWCPRSSWYVIKDGKRPNESLNFQRLNIFAEGHNIHNKWQNWLWRTGIIEGNWECRACTEKWYGVSPTECPTCSGRDIGYREVPITNSEYHLLGHADGIINDQSGRAVLEIKSVGIGTLRYESPELFAKYNKKEIGIDGLWNGIKHPFASHLRQVNLYMYCLGLTDGVVLYEWKPTQEVKEFAIKFQKELIDHVLAGCATVKTALDNNTTPMRPFTASLDSPMCKNCAHYNRCWSIDEDRTDDHHADTSGDVPVEVRHASPASGEGSASPRVIRRSV